MASQVINQKRHYHKFIEALALQQFQIVTIMCLIYETPSNSNSEAFQCPPTPRKYRVAGNNPNHQDPIFFPSSSSIFGTKTCVTESTCDTAVDSLLDSVNELPVTVLVLKPKSKSRYLDNFTSRRRKLSISEINGDIPPLPYKVSPSKKSNRRSSSDPDQMTKKLSTSVPPTKTNAAPLRRMSIKNIQGSRRKSINARSA